MIQFLAVPAVAYGAYSLYDKYFKSDAEKAREKKEQEMLTYVGLGVASVAAIYIGYKASLPGDEK